MPFSLSDISGPQSTRSWQVLLPANDDYESVAAAVGPKISRAIHGTMIYYPTGGAIDEEGKIWIASYYAQQHRLNEMLEIEHTPDIKYQAPANGDGIGYMQDMSLTTDGSKLLLATSYGHHCVKVYGRDTDDLISVIGVPGSAGNIDDGKLWNPHSCVRLANGNIVVSSYNGFGSGATKHGSISEWDISTPVATLVSTRMAYTDDGQSAAGNSEIFRPMRITWGVDWVDSAGTTHNDSQYLWVSEYGRGRILKVDPATWKTVNVLNAPTGVASIGNSYGLCQMSDGTIVVASNTASLIIGIDPVTESAVFEIDPSVFSSSVNMRGVFEIQPGYLCWFDWSSQTAYVTRTAALEIPFDPIEIPTGFEIESTVIPSHFNPDGPVMTVMAGDIPQLVQPTPVLFKKAV